MNEIVALKRQGLSISEIAGMMGHDRKTVRKYLLSRETPSYGPRAARESKLDEFKGYVDERLTSGVWNAVVLLRELRERGYAGSYTILKDYIAPKRRAAREVCVRRFETPPGRQAQVDWGHLGSAEDGADRRKVWGFVMSLGSSRAMFADAATDQTLETLLWMHEEAFRQLGGVPQEILYDRMKTVVLGTDERGEVRWHPVFLDFARYWGFTPRLCRAYRPETKGKVESGIRYLRSSFIPGREVSSVEDLRNQLRSWVWGVANRRVHGTTHRVVIEALEEERKALQPIGGRPCYPYVPEVLRRVGRDGYVSYGSNRYPVPWRVAGQDVSVQETGNELVIRRGSERVAVHEISRGRHLVIPDKSGYHSGMPFHDRERPASGRLQIIASAPSVEVRPLAAYEAVCGGGVSR